MRLPVANDIGSLFYAVGERGHGREARGAGRGARGAWDNRGALGAGRWAHGTTAGREALGAGRMGQPRGAGRWAHGTTDCSLLWPRALRPAPRASRPAPRALRLAPRASTAWRWFLIPPPAWPGSAKLFARSDGGHTHGVDQQGHQRGHGQARLLRARSLRKDDQPREDLWQSEARQQRQDDLDVDGDRSHAL